MPKDLTAASMYQCRSLTAYGWYGVTYIDQLPLTILANASHLALNHAPCAVYWVEYIDPVPITLSESREGY